VASGARAAVTAMRLSLTPSSGGVLPQGDDDVVAEGLELSSGVAGFAAAVGVPGVPVRSEVAVAGRGVVEQVPDDAAESRSGWRCGVNQLPAQASQALAPAAVDTGEVVSPGVLRRAAAAAGRWLAGDVAAA
jgi:hypothetical protein